MPTNKPNFARLFFCLPIQGACFSDQFFKHSEDHCNTSNKVKYFSEVFNLNVKWGELLQNILVAVTIFTVNNNNILSGFLPVDKEGESVEIELYNRFKFLLHIQGT